MHRPAFLSGVALLALASLLLAPQSSFAQYLTYPGGWAQPGRGSGYGYSGFAPVPDTLPFPYNGVSGTFAPVYAPPAAAPVMATTTNRVATKPASDNRRAYIHVRVPASARVFIEGDATAQRGADRVFVSPRLNQDANYSYEVSATWMQDGRERHMNRTVRFAPGETVDVDFTTPSGDQ